MYVRNKTSEWRDKLPKEKLDKALDFAKKIEKQTEGYLLPKQKINSGKKKQ